MEHGDVGRVRLTEAARHELQLLLWLAPTVRCELAWPVAPVIHMVDAGPKQGAVVYCNPVPTPLFSEQVEPPPRHRWKLAIQRTWSSELHNNLQEGKTVLWAVSRCARSGLRGALCVIYTDSLVVKGAFTKGRSSSVPLNRLCRRFAALCTAFRLRVILKYVPSALNWADGPSRGLKYPCVAPETQAKARSIGVSCRVDSALRPRLVRAPPGL